MSPENYADFLVMWPWLEHVNSYCQYWFDMKYVPNGHAWFVKSSFNYMRTQGNYWRVIESVYDPEYGHEEAFWRPNTTVFLDLSKTDPATLDKAAYIIYGVAGILGTALILMTIFGPGLLKEPGFVPPEYYFDEEDNRFDDYL